MTPEDSEHYCDDVHGFPIGKFLQLGAGRAGAVLILGESPAPNGWRKSGMACYNSKGKLLPTGRNLNALLGPLELSVEACSFTELSKCYIGKDRKQLDVCSARCWPILLRQLRANDFKLIIVLGLGTTRIFEKLINQELAMGQIAGVAIENQDYLVLPIYHPSPISPNNHRRNLVFFAALEPQLMEVLG